MSFSNQYFLAAIAVALGGSISAYAQTPIEPLMETVPGGSFEMGSDDANHTKPVHTVNIRPFSMGKYEVTVREFRHFVEATGYDAPQECRHELDDWMMPASKGSWDNNFPTTNEFMPVVCIGWQGANAYAEWLAKETGKPYRLPSEAEWEYAALAGARTKFHFGDDADDTELCTYGNSADLGGENILQRTSNTSYENFAEGKSNCNDYAGYASIIGMYKPNKFGLHNMIGNVFEFVADCYVPNYEGAPSDGSARIEETCERHSVRGSSWHWKADAQTTRMGFGDFIGGIEGFRLALDGKAPQKSDATLAFERDLKFAQTSEQKKRDAAPALPKPVENLRIEQTNQMVTLSWDKNDEPGFTTYRVYRNRVKGGRYRLIADNLLTTSFKDANFEPHIYEYRVVAVRNHMQGDYSNIVETKPGWVKITDRLEAEYYSKITGAAARASYDTSRHTYGLTGRGGISKDAVIDYQVDITEAGTYRLGYRVTGPRDGEGFELWLNGKKIATSSIKETGGYWEWQDQTGGTVTLPAGRHRLQIRSLDTNWKLDSLSFSKTS